MLGVVMSVLAAILAAANLLGFAQVSWWIVIGIAVAPIVIAVLFALVVLIGTFIGVSFASRAHKPRRLRV